MHSYILFQPDLLFLCFYVTRIGCLSLSYFITASKEMACVALQGLLSAYTGHGPIANHLADVSPMLVIC